MTLTLNPSDADVAAVKDGLGRLEDAGGDLTAAVARYLDPKRMYAQDQFDRMAEGPANQVTPADLLAVTLLDLSTPVAMVRELLSPDYGGEGTIDVSLAAMPSEVDLWDADDDTLRHAYSAWEAIIRLRGVGPVRASKVLARKRPRLIPIWDHVVADFFGNPDTVWASMRDALQDGSLRERLWALRPDDWPPSMTLLRLIDIGAWMYYR